MTDLAGYNDIVPPSTGKKKKARKVFGNVLSNGDVNHSLSYTPSPIKDANESAETESSSKLEERVVTNLFSIAESARESPLPGGRGRKSDNSFSFSQKSTCRSECSTVCRSQQSTVVVKPFSNIIGDVDSSDKENLSNVQVPQSIRVPSEKHSVHSKLSVDNFLHDSSMASTTDSVNSRRHFSTSRGLGSLSSTGSDCAIPSKPLHAIDRKPGRSVNQALNAAKQAKERALKEKAKAAAMIRGQWKEEKDEALDFNEESEKLRRDQLNLQTHLSSQFSRARAKRNQQVRQGKREATDKESNFKSSVAREQKQKLKEQEDMRRRQSTAVRAKIRVNNRQGEEKLQLMKIGEEQAILEERHCASKARQQYQRERADSRRKSFLFRSGDAIRIRELHASMESQRKQEKHESFEFMLGAARDVDEYHSGLAEQRRTSLAYRNAEASEQRKKTEDELSSEKQAERESYELKRTAESDADNYKRQQEQERRASLAFRNKEGRKHREILAKLRGETMTSEQESFKLKFEADKDAEAYVRSEALLRRKSLAKRNFKAREIRTKESHEESEQLQKEHASWELKLGGEKDAEEYHRKRDEMRRQSVANRNQEAKQQRVEEEKRQEEAQELEHKSYELNWNGGRDAQAYRDRLQEERRKSLNYRNLEARQQRIHAEDQRSANLQAEQESFGLKRAADKDGEEYVKKTEKEQREHLAFRNQEKVRHAKVMEELNSLAREEEAGSYMLKWAGDNDATEYVAQLEEERRQSLQFRNQEARRHKEIDDGVRHDELAGIHEDEVLKAGGHKDMEKYRKECAERDRASLEYHKKEAMIQRLEESNRLEREREKEGKIQELETLARQDVKGYFKSCKNERRKSLALRAKERRRHVDWVNVEEQRQLQEQRNDARLKARDSRSMELARQRERSEQAMQALRHANCTFSSFPTS